MKNWVIPLALLLLSVIGVAWVVQINSGNIEAHRVRQEQIHACMVELLLTIARNEPGTPERNLAHPCPDVGTVPERH